jgi:hypothetical protein
MGLGKALFRAGILVVAAIVPGGFLLLGGFLLAKKKLQG